jgi:hypothetical protein
MYSSPYYCVHSTNPTPTQYGLTADYLTWQVAAGRPGAKPETRQARTGIEILTLGGGKKPCGDRGARSQRDLQEPVHGARPFAEADQYQQRSERGTAVNRR